MDEQAETCRSCGTALRDGAEKSRGVCDSCRGSEGKVMK